MTEPQEPAQRPDPTQPEWQTTEFPAIQRFPSYLDEPGDQYGQSPYAAPQYGSAPPQGAQPQYGAAPSSYPIPSAPFAPAPPPRRRRTALLVAAAVVVAAGAGVGVYFGVHNSGTTKTATGQQTPPPSTTAPSTPSPSSPSPTVTTTTPNSTGKLVAPTTFDGYSVVNNAIAQAAKDKITSAAQGSDSDASMFISASTITVYGKTGSALPSLIVVALPAGSVPGGLNGDAFTESFLADIPGKQVSVAAGPHGGSSRCVDASSSDETLCAWSDSSTAGGIVSVNPALPITGLTAVQNAFRNYADRG